jgi:phage/plasmid-associated DNA primase
LDSRLAVVTEAGGEGKKAEEINMEALKRITGEDVISAQAKFKGKREGVFRARVVFLCNSMPKMPQSQAQRRRTIVAEMNTKMLDKSDWDELSPEEQASGDFALKDSGFIQRLRENRSGTLNWLLDGAKRFMANPLMPPPLEVLRYTDEALAQADEHRLWFSDGWVFDKTNTKAPYIPFKEVAEKWCEHFGIKTTNMSSRGKFLAKIKSWIGEAYVVGDSNHGYELRCLTPR